MIIVDFEGEPARSLEERRGRWPATRDLAGYRRSLDYAKVVGGRDAEWVSTLWEVFLVSYLKRTHRPLAGSDQPEARPHVPQDLDDVKRLTSVFELQKAIHEVHYELSHRLDWVHIPLRGILETLNAS